MITSVRRSPRLTLPLPLAMTQLEHTNGQGAPLGANLSDRVSAAPPLRAPGRWRRLLAAIVILYTLSVAGLWAWMMLEGDNEWLATMLLFGPRWLCGLPLPLLVVAAAIWSRRLLVILAIAAYVLIGPLMGFKFNLPVSSAAPTSLKVLTCNVDQNNFNPRALSELIMGTQPDVVALQEVSTETKFIWPKDWQVLVHDEFIVASRWPIREDGSIRRNIYELSSARFLVQLPDREVQVFNIHLKTPRAGLEAVLKERRAAVERLDAVLDFRARESEGVSLWVNEYQGPKIVLGDFNTPGESVIFRRDWSALTDAFAARGWGFGFTKISPDLGWAYGTRIDHVLSTDEIVPLRARVGPSVGSDHLPLLVEFE
jgi:vancomycin resistance protein VanJ